MRFRLIAHNPLPSRQDLASESRDTQPSPAISGNPIPVDKTVSCKSGAVNNEQAPAGNDNADQRHLTACGNDWRDIANTPGVALFHISRGRGGELTQRHVVPLSEHDRRRRVKHSASSAVSATSAIARTVAPGPRSRRGYVASRSPCLLIGGQAGVSLSTTPDAISIGTCTGMFRPQLGPRSSAMAHPSGGVTSDKLSVTELPRPMIPVPYG